MYAVLSKNCMSKQLGEMLIGSILSGGGKENKFLFIASFLQFCTHEKSAKLQTQPFNQSGSINGQFEGKKSSLHAP